MRRHHVLVVLALLVLAGCCCNPCPGPSGTRVEGPTPCAPTPLTRIELRNKRGSNHTIVHARVRAHTANGTDVVLWQDLVGCQEPVQHSPREECWKCAATLPASNAADSCAAHKPDTFVSNARAVHYELRFDGDNTTYNVCVTANSPSTQPPAPGETATCLGLDANGNCASTGAQLRYVHLHYKNYMGERHNFTVIRGVYTSDGSLVREEVVDCWIPRAPTN